MNNLNVAFGKVLKIYRKEAGLSQEQLALQCDLDRTYIGLLERAERQPTITTIFKICTALNVKPHEFIKDIEKLIN
ncbi:helix-turn-helix domain-containing protein [Lysinibacillus fusiformis]|uniref:helix-turn-helix domain-containing protein n=1 Tax=Lysinibacillus fusiformis TaxID=28031 RepID=UPI0021C03643|nr:helix-turn-helix transcriptional regulator [Lysinibacillus fusiformis]UXJ71360.1 helix-turn-helix domain-containing protein [Lysinibacillus fusiformis]